MKVLGFGGVFWRTNDVDRLRSWYQEVLGISLDEHWNGTIFPPNSGDIIFSLFTKETAYFPTEQQVMLNFRVESMEECVAHLKELGIPLLKETEHSEFGIFNWITDPDGRLIELWKKI
ncbi:VOC family protein [Chungangia koreensis]|uniref:VOC family protein n=1 Tax=Chungangia koreensis TaxID=752657 RepID=A0ABV8X0M1_9LACT